MNFNIWGCPWHKQYTRKGNRNYVRQNISNSWWTIHATYAHCNARGTGTRDSTNFQCEYSMNERMRLSNFIQTTSVEWWNTESSSGFFGPNSQPCHVSTSLISGDWGKYVHNISHSSTQSNPWPPSYSLTTTHSNSRPVVSYADPALSPIMFRPCQHVQYRVCCLPTTCLAQYMNSRIDFPRPDQRTRMINT